MPRKIRRHRRTGSNDGVELRPPSIPSHEQTLRDLHSLGSTILFASVVSPLEFSLRPLC
jgi:hypothetical protein